MTSLQVERKPSVGWQSIVIVLIKRREGLNVAFTAVGVQYTCVSLTQILHSWYGTLRIQVPMRTKIPVGTAKFD